MRLSAMALVSSILVLTLIDVAGAQSRDDGGAGPAVKGPASQVPQVANTRRLFVPYFRSSTAPRSAE